MALMRTAKSCRSDAPRLASSLREEAQATVSNKPGHRGEREVSRKTIARGMPGDFRCDRGDYARVLFSFAREAAGALGTRHSLRPLISQGERLLQNLGRTAPRECGRVSQTVIPAQRLCRCRWRCEPCGALAPLGEPRRMSGAGRRPSRRIAFAMLLRMTGIGYPKIESGKMRSRCDP